MSVHVGALAVEGSEGAIAIHDKAKRVLRVTMRRRHLSRQDELKTGVKRLRSARLARHGRIFEDQHPSLRLGGSDELTGFHQHRLNPIEGPGGRNRGRARRRSDERCENFPERRKVFGAKPLIELGARQQNVGRICGCSHRPYSEGINDRVENELAVEDANLFGEAQPFRHDYDSVEVSAGVEHFAWLISLRTDHEIISFGKYRVAVAADDMGRPDDVTLVVRCVE